VDVGGTKIAAGLVDGATGAVSLREQIHTRPERGGRAVLDDVLMLTRRIGARAREAGTPSAAIGLGVCELVDTHGAVRSDFTLAWSLLDVRGELGTIAPAAVDADVRAHALAEAVFGAGAARDPFVFVSIGTGISCCLVQGGVPYAGARGNALVLATGPVSIPDESGALKSFVLEEYASGPALARRFGVKRAEAVFAAAESGDAGAHRLLGESGAAMGAALGWLASVLDPAALVIGGGLGSVDGPYWDALQREARAHIWSEATRALPIVHAALGRDAGIVGAALTALRPSKGQAKST
jgi:glucokinase